MKQVQLKKVKQGDYFRLTPNNSPVWVRDNYDRYEKRYWCHKFDNVNHFILIGGDRIVFTDFDF